MIELTRSGDNWKLPLDGQDVTQLRFDFAVTLMFEGGQILRIETPFTVKSDGHSDLVNPEGGVSDIAPALALARTTVESGTAGTDGSLRMTFSNGFEISVPPGDEYESWQFSGQSGLLVVSLPSGELGFWENGRP